MEKLKINTDLFMDSELEQTSRELYNAFVNDAELYKEVKEDGFTDEEIYDNIGTFTDLRQSRESEKLVKTYEDCVKYNCFYHTKIVRRPYGLEKVYDAIKPYKEFLIYNSKFLFKDFPDSCNKVCWKDINNKVAKDDVVRKIKANNWVYLSGALRSGRTYLAIATINAKVGKTESKVAFIDAVKRFGELARIYFSDNNDFREMMGDLCNVDLLVIDNFGSEYKNSIVRDAILIPLLEKRAAANKMTIFTSNHTISRVQKMYALKKDDGGEVAAEQLANILNSMTQGEIVVSNIPLY